MDNSIRVLQVFASLNMGGAESRMMDVYRHLDKSEVKFDFVTLTKGDQYYVNEIEALGGTVFYIDSPRDVGIKKHISQLYECMRSGKYDAVHAHTSYHCGLVMLAAKLAKIPVRISHARTNGSQTQKNTIDITIKLGRFLINNFSTHRFAISKSAGEYVFGKKSHYEVVPNAIDVDKYFNVSPSEIEDLRNEFDLNEDSFVIGQIGRFDIMKNHTFTVKWFSQYVKSNSNAVLFFVGNGPLQDEIMDECNKLGISDKVFFTGVRNDVEKIIHIFNLLFFPSPFEGLGGVVLEAQAAGVPVVQSEAIPAESDLGIGLIKRCSLNDKLDNWNKAVDEFSHTLIPSISDRKSAFDRAGYTIDSTVKKYVNTYRGLY